MASSVAAPLERQFATIAGITQMTSVSGTGASNITIQFDLDRSIPPDGAAARRSVGDNHRRAQTAARDDHSYRLPEGEPRRSAGSLSYRFLVDPAAVGRRRIRRDHLLAQRISMLKGVAQVQVYGGQKYAVRVQDQPRSSATRGIGVDEIQNAVINRQLRTRPVGNLNGS